MVVPVVSRTFIAVVVLLLASATAQAQSVPLPREKPGAAGETEGADSEAQDAASETEDAASETEDAATETEDAASETEDAASEAEDAAGKTEDVVQPSSCFQKLEAAGVVARRVADFVNEGQCIVEDPVVVEAVDTRNGLLSLPGHPVLECQFAAAFAAWLREVVSPVAASQLGSPVDEVITGPGHQCRNRAGGRLSEHAIGNAVDVSGFRLVGGRRIGVETMVTAKDAELEFLSAISGSACGYFTTVLGPGSDAAHSDHLHLDLALRSVPEFRICMTR